MSFKASNLTEASALRMQGPYSGYTANLFFRASPLNIPGTATISLSLLIPVPFHSSNPHDYDSTKAFGLLDKYDDEGRYKRVKNPSLKRFFNNTEQEKAYRNASKEMDDYVMGNYDYDKENGWHVKESVEKAVNTVLKEYFNKKK